MHPDSCIFAAMMKQLLLLLILGISSTLTAQYYQPVFPDLEGEELRVATKDNYKPATVLGFGPARDTLFSKIDGHNDSLTCVYTGHTIYLDPSLDPTEAAYMNASNNGINTEHTYPQAFGAGSGNPRSDMHHLFPTRTPVNNARGNLPFGDIPDNQTDTWYFLNQQTSSVPGANIDAYSEITNDRFEPREDHKGDVARAMFYFYLMYTVEANAANPTYFESQRNTFCTWHFQDPVDEKEWNRTWEIAQRQDGKPNPFVLDCTLAARLYCTEFEDNCEITPVKETELQTPFKIEKQGPNPFQDEMVFQYSLSEAFRVNVQLYNAIGQLIGTLIDEEQTAGQYELQVDQEYLSGQQAGAYYLQVHLNGQQQYFIPQKLIYLPK